MPWAFVSFRSKEPMGEGAPVSSDHDESLPPVVPIEQIARWEGQAVTIRGWLYNLRASGKILFPIFRDGTGLLQGVVVQSAGSPGGFCRPQKPAPEGPPDRL